MPEIKHKLSASALSTYLKSPKQYYWKYVARLEPAIPSISTFDHDKLAGVAWAAFVDRFYNHIGEQENRKQLFQEWADSTEGWVPEKIKAKLTSALDSWATTYYQLFNPDDGTRGQGKSELFLENKRFLGYLDGLSDDGIVHEVKSTSRGKQIAAQLWKYQTSIQVKLYCVLAKATGIRIEMAYKDEPYSIYRSEVLPVTPEQVKCWESELNALADHIYKLGDKICNYPCNPEGCSIITKNFCSVCPFDALCTYGLTDETNIAFKEKTHRK